MLTNMKRCCLRLCLPLAILLASFATSASAQQRYAFCFNGPYYGSTSNSAYFTAAFPIPDSLTADQFGQIGWNGEPTASFRRYLIDKYAVSATPTEPDGPADANNTVCNVYPTLSAANEGIRRQESYARTTTHRVVREVTWVYSPMRQATYTSLAKPTEAEALYDAETHVLSFPPFENNKYLVIHRWDKHECDEQTKKTMVYGHPKTTTTYTCTVTYSYSETASPLAKTSLGSGAAPDEAVDKAKSNIYGARWSPPVCSKTFKASAYQSKPSYKVGDTPGGSDWWVCAVEYTVSP